jgi:hypothetical protein
VIGGLGALLMRNLATDDRAPADTSAERTNGHAANGSAAALPVPTPAAPPTEPDDPDPN